MLNKLKKVMNQELENGKNNKFHPKVHLNLVPISKKMAKNQEGSRLSNDKKSLEGSLCSVFFKVITQFRAS